MESLLSRGSAPAPGPVIVLVAGEVSGDLLGADLILSLKRHFPHARFVGIGGERMMAAGLQSIVPMERLSVMGLVEVLGRIRELFDVRARVREYCLNNRPAALIGIDSPDFTLGLERQVREAGIPTVHYVSPSVWAWRRGRLKGIAKSVDLMLTLLPFEASVYRDYGIPVRFVGHPMADQIPDEPDRKVARKELDLPESGQMVALLPGSRGSEVGGLGPLFLETAAWLADAMTPVPTFVIPCINRQRREQIQAMIQGSEAWQALDLRLVDGQSRTVMTAADAVLLASGTATLEAALLKRPMVVAYRVNALTFWIASRLVYVDHVALPNLLAPEPVVPEFLQEDATAGALGAALKTRLTAPETIEHERAIFSEIHNQLRRNASDRAAESVAALIRGDPLPEDLEDA
ncbi:lipid-A-disaccharide synthase [Vreelandella utahensis]|uniref:lipid-A-disaccharide synthase n=1 Tax=Vreelandella halophila TaxID=86177 RepID=UPI000986480E|nr:lipid-A-disaccharide synthase [Halomonas utahensis]